MKQHFAPLQLTGSVGTIESDSLRRLKPDTPQQIKRPPICSRLKCITLGRRIRDRGRYHIAVRVHADPDTSPPQRLVVRKRRDGHLAHQGPLGQAATDLQLGASADRQRWLHRRFQRVVPQKFRL